MAIAQILLRGGTTVEWAATNPVLADREVGIDTTLHRIKVGDGVTAWLQLPWATVDGAEVSRLEAAAQALDGAVTPTDAVMATVAATPGSAFAGQLSATYVGVASGWSDAQRALHAEEASRGRSEINVLVFGADPTGATDSTAAINAAIATAKTFDIGAVYIPSGRYLINGTIRVTHEVSLYGQYAAFSPTSGERVSGTVLVAGNNAAGDPVIEVKNPVAGGYLAGVSLRDLFVLGSASWTSASGAKDRVGIRLHKVISEYSIARVMVTGFLRQGLQLQEVWDGTIINSRIMYCGTAGTYAALSLEGTTEGNTNSLHAFGLHIENSPFLLSISGDSRHNGFTGCKFELFSTAPTASAILIGPSLESTFLGCYFVSRNADDPLYVDASVQPAFIHINGPRAHVTFTDCMATVAPYSGAPTVDPASGTATTFYGGARWLYVQSGRMQWRGGIVDNAWCGSGAAPFRLSSRSSFKDTTIYTGSKGGGRSLFALEAESQIGGNDIRATNPAQAISSGSLFTCNGARNVLGPNVIGEAVNTYLSAAVQQTVIRSSGDEVTRNSGTSWDLGWVDRFATDRFVASMPSASSVNQFTGGWAGREVLVRFANANTTLAHSANLVLKGAVNTTPPAGAFMQFVALTATTWAETSRSF